MTREEKLLACGVLFSDLLQTTKPLPPVPTPQAPDGPRYLFNPYASRSVGNTFRTWEEVVAAIAAGQAAPTVVFARPGQYQIAQSFDLRRGKLASLTPATGTVTVTLAEGAQIDNATGIESGIGLIVKPKTAPCFTYSDFTTEPVVFVVSYGAALQNVSSTGMQAFPVVASGRYLVVAFFNASTRSVAPSTAPLVRCSGGNLICPVQGSLSCPLDGWAEDTTGTSVLNYQCDSTFPELGPLTPGFAPSNVVRLQGAVSRSVSYTPTNPADWLAWTTVAPDNVGQALDLLAAKP